MAPCPGGKKCKDHVATIFTTSRTGLEQQVHPVDPQKFERSLSSVIFKFQDHQGLSPKLAAAYLGNKICIVQVQLKDAKRTFISQIRNSFIQK